MLKRTDLETVERVMVAAWDERGLIKVDGSGLRDIIRRTAERLDNGEPNMGGPTIEERVPEMYGALKAALGGGRSGAKEGNQAQRLIGYALEDASELFLDQ